MNLFLVSGGLGGGVNDLSMGVYVCISALRDLFIIWCRVSGRRRRSVLRYDLAFGWLYDDSHFIWSVWGESNTMLYSNEQELHVTKI
jgi:hypothetical protein